MLYTNWDHIHAMNLEEFAKWFANLDSICGYCSHYGDEDCGAKYCEESFNNFLNREYEGGF